MANPKSTAPVTSTSSVSNDDEPDFSKWSKEQVGFAPYWNPEPGSKVFASIVARDERDPEFVRYLCRAEGKPVQCQRGPSEDAESVMVTKGETFTVSVYSALAEVFDFYLNSGLSPRFQLVAKDKKKTNTPGRTVWQWDLLVDPDLRPKLDALRAKTSTKQISNGGERPQLES